MGLIRPGRHPFRKHIRRLFQDQEGFEYYPHPGHDTKDPDAIINEKYAMELNRAKIFFTCGSKFKYPVAKYMEAPACNTLLLAEPNKDILDLGFVDGVNFIACDIHNVYHKAMYYLSNSLEREKIALNGYKFVHEHHSNDIRAKEFINSITTFINKKN